MITFESSGDFERTRRALQKMSKGDMFRALDGLAQQGVAALAAATPVDTGQTKNSWNYQIDRSRGGVTITWTNNHMAGGAPVAIMLQYGHGTGTGGYVRGRDYINPAIRPEFDKIADEVWKAVTSA